MTQPYRFYKEMPEEKFNRNVKALLFKYKKQAPVIAKIAVSLSDSEIILESQKTGEQISKEKGYSEKLNEINENLKEINKTLNRSNKENEAYSWSEKGFPGYSEQMNYELPASQTGETSKKDENQMEKEISPDAKGSNEIPTQETKEPENLEEITDKEIKDAKRRQYKEGDVVSEIKIVPKIFINKLWGAVPAVAVGGVGLTLGAIVAAAIAAPLAVGAAVTVAATGIGAYTGGKIPLNQDNWYVQGRFGKLFGQKGAWVGHYTNTQIVANVYKRDCYIDKTHRPWRRDKNGNKITEPMRDKEGNIEKYENGEIKYMPIPEDGNEYYHFGTWYHIGKLARKLPDKINEEGIKETMKEISKQLIKQGIKGNELKSMLEDNEKKVRRLVKRNVSYAGISQHELLNFDPREGEKDWNRQIVDIEDISSENNLLKSKEFKNVFRNGVGKLCYTIFKDGSRWMGVKEIDRPAKIEGIGLNLIKMPFYFVKEATGLNWPWKWNKPRPAKAFANAVKNTGDYIWKFPKYFNGLGGRLYEVKDIREDKQWFLEKDPIKSICWGNHYDFCDVLDEEVSARISKKRIKSLLYSIVSLGKRPYYKMKISDQHIAQNKEFVRALVPRAYQTNAEKKTRRLRFGYEKDEKGNTVPTPYNPRYIEKEGMTDVFRDNVLVNR